MHLIRRFSPSSFFLRSLALLALGALVTTGWAAKKQPNIILVMSDDMGWGDVAYNGNKRVKTPVLDRLSKEGVRLDRFYAMPVCTPTRASCMTGRNPNRTGNVWAGDFPLPLKELTIAELLRDAGYRTGHFGKWHLGKMTPDCKEGLGEQTRGPETYVAPWHQGFQTCFSTESAAPNYNPAVWGEMDAEDATTKKNEAYSYQYIMNRPIVYGEGTLVGKKMKPWPFSFWLGENQKAPDVIAGDSSELIMNHAVPFIEECAKEKKPFFAVVWFVTAHTPVAAGPEARSLYPDLPIEAQHWFGAISAMDAQIGRLLETLRKQGIEDDTIVWFCSDNGPSWVHDLNSAGPLRGKKSEVYDGGIRVPAIVRWPAGLKGGRTINAPLSTLDFLPTLLAASGTKPAKLLPLDGENVLPVLRAEAKTRKAPLFYDFPYRDITKVTWVPTKMRQYAVIDGPWKLVSVDDKKSFQLYDLNHDIGEKSDLAAAHPDQVKRLRAGLDRWTVQYKASLSGADYK